MNYPEKADSFGVRAALLCVRFYQLFFSPLLHALFGPGFGCRFEPTCSCYAAEAFRKRGFMRGCALAFGRIMRCHPWSEGGFDPVPDLKNDARQDIAP